jgi:hypothetical protein
VSHFFTCFSLFFFFTGKVSPSKDKEKGSFTTGASLSKVLVSTYELTLTSGTKVGVKVSSDGLQVINTLKSLLLVSHSAKCAALDSKFLFYTCLSPLLLFLLLISLSSEGSGCAGLVCRFQPAHRGQLIALDWFWVMSPAYDMACAK